MHQAAAKRLLKGLADHYVDDKNRCQSTDLIPLETRYLHGVKIKIPHFHELKHSKSDLADVWKNLSNKSKQAKIVGNLPQKSGLRSLSADSLKPKSMLVGKFPRYVLQINRESHSSNATARNVDRHERIVSGRLSLLIGKGNTCKVRTPSGFKEKSQNAEGATRIPHATELHLFHTLECGPLPFLELHSRLGVSKHTIRGFVNKGLLAEVWGPNSVGIRYELSNKGKARLNELETAARYESSARGKGLIRLKNRLA